MKTAYEKFKKDCPSLDFDKKDIITIRLPLKRFDWEEYEQQLNSLKKDSVDIPEMKYLVSFMSNILRIAKREEKKNLTLIAPMLVIDLNKLKYCKTLLAYFEEEYSEGILNGLDYIQDQIVEEFEIDKHRVFYFSEHGESETFALSDGEETIDAYITTNIPGSIILEEWYEYYWSRDFKDTDDFVKRLKERFPKFQISKLQYEPNTYRQVFVN